jgi:hypothetical protein
MTKSNFVLASPALQISFAHRLVAMQASHLQPALLATVASIDIIQLDAELAAHVSRVALQKLASLGMRGEVLFATPAVLMARPMLLTYYRTLLGYSQKEFYKTGSGLGSFRSGEEAGVWNHFAQSEISNLCGLLNRRALELLDGIGSLRLAPQFFSDLSLLSVGPQFRGGSNNARGEAGIEQVFDLILKTIKHAKPKVNLRSASLVNAAGRNVVIEVAADPDVVIKETSSGQGDRPLVAIEVKAGTDVSNIHNRIGEAEKSHLKAKVKRFTECWTIVNVPSLDMKMAQQQSPSTHKFFQLAELLQPTSSQRADFVASIVDLVGIRAKASKKKAVGGQA